MHPPAYRHLRCTNNLIDFMSFSVSVQFSSRCESFSSPRKYLINNVGQDWLPWLNQAGEKGCAKKKSCAFLNLERAMYPFMARVKLGATLRSPKSAIPESKVLPVAPSIVVLKFGTTGKPRLLISIYSSASSVQYTITGDNGKQFSGNPL